MMGDCALQDPRRIRARVRGNNGPDRKLLPSFHRLGIYDPIHFRLLEGLVIEQLAMHPKDYNDIENPDTYEIAQTCKLKTYFPAAYKQILLQVTGNRPEDADEIPDEWEYQQYLGEAVEFQGLINQFVDPHFRARIAYLPAGEELKWHIDTNTSYACRIQIMIHGMHKFMINRKGKIEEQIMQAGEVWFCNTGFSHRIEVLGDEPKVGIVLGCHYKAIENQMPCFN